MSVSRPGPAVPAAREYSVRVTLTPDEHGDYRCPLCRRLCTLAWLLGPHTTHHAYSVDGQQHAELEWEVTAAGVIAVVADRWGSAP